jgi:hypothetical protein
MQQAAYDHDTCGISFRFHRGTGHQAATEDDQCTYNGAYDPEEEHAQPTQLVSQRPAHGGDSRQDHQGQVQDPLAGGDGNSQAFLHTGQADLGGGHVDGPGG